jgi:hypothetical protein
VCSGIFMSCTAKYGLGFVLEVCNVNDLGTAYGLLLQKICSENAGEPAEELQEFAEEFPGLRLTNGKRTLAGSRGEGWGQG